jgi:hypothetical protein
MINSIHVYGDSAYDDSIIAKIKKLLQDEGWNVKITVERDNFEPTIKLSHADLFELVEYQQMAYFKAHGGVFAVAKENGFALSQESADAILEYIGKPRPQN